MAFLCSKGGDTKGTTICASVFLFVFVSLASGVGVSFNDGQSWPRLGTGRGQIRGTQYGFGYIGSSYRRQVFSNCGGELQERAGIISTPRFPRPFPVPIYCRWVINASAHPDSAIVVYLTQLYVVEGFRVTTYTDYDFEKTYATKNESSMFSENFERLVTLRSEKPFMVLELNADTLDNIHFRSSDSFLDVYGFNVTYEIVPKSFSGKKNCSVIKCSAAGNCYVSADFSEMKCTCFDGFFGEFCQYGASCNPKLNITQCKNGGTCTYLGERTVKCNCPPGFNGTMCEKEDSNIKACYLKNDSDLSKPCNCNSTAEPARYVRYEGLIKVKNLDLEPIRSASSTHTSSDMVPAQPRVKNQMLKRLVSQLRSHFREYNVTHFNRFAILEIKPGSEITFHFFGTKSEENITLSAFDVLRNTKKLGDFQLGVKMTYENQMPLFLQKLEVNRQRIRLNDGFTLTCVAQGSDYMKFQWYKDGTFVNTSKAVRFMTQSRLPKAVNDIHTAHIYIDDASDLDKGTYTCRVTDWNHEQCRSFHLDVLQPPILEVLPMSVTIRKGESVNITCIAQNDGFTERFGYNWEKDGGQLRPTPGLEMMEDLYPLGSILKINKTKTSATYACLVRNSAGASSKSVRVEVLSSDSVPTCPKERYLDIEWPLTVVGQTSLQFCPRNYTGVTSRRCQLRDSRGAKWDEADFSQCVLNEVLILQKQFQKLKLGYNTTTSGIVLSNLSRLTKQRAIFYPGEGEFTLELLEDALHYFIEKETPNDLRASAEEFVNILDDLLGYPKAIKNEEKVTALRSMMEKFAASLAAPLPFDTPIRIMSESVLLEMLRPLQIRYYNVSSNLEKSYPSWFNDQLNLTIPALVPSYASPSGKDNSTLAVIIYRNLHSILRQRYLTAIEKDVEVMYEINSHLVTITRDSPHVEVSALQGSPIRDRNRTTRSVAVSMMLSPLKAYDPMKWTVSCGRINGSTNRMPSRVDDWNLDACNLVTTSQGVTCKCDSLGTYALLQVTHPNPPEINASSGYDVVIVIGCSVCLVLTAVVMIILLIHWRSYRRHLFYLKIQFCMSVIGTMTLFLCAGQDLVPKVSYLYVCIFLEVFVLLSLASQFSKVLLIYNEIIQFPWTRHVKQIAVILIVAALPLLPLAATITAQKTLGWYLSSWWLTLDNSSFFISFVVSVLIVVVFFVVLYYLTFTKLTALARAAPANNRLLSARIGLIQRAGVIFLCCLFMIVSSILYINIPNVYFQYTFCISCVLLGLIVFMYYTLRSESPIPVVIVSRLRFLKPPDYDEHGSNSLKSFNKTERHHDNTGTDPKESRSLLQCSVASAQTPTQLLQRKKCPSASCSKICRRAGCARRANHHVHHHQLIANPTTPVTIVSEKLNADEGTTLEKSVLIAASPYVISRSNPGTQETFVHSLEGSAEMKEVESAAESDNQLDSGTEDDAKQKVPLEKYSSSPRKYLYQSEEAVTSPMWAAGGNNEMGPVSPTKHGRAPFSKPFSSPSSVEKSLKLLCDTCFTQDTNSSLKPEPGTCYIRDSPEIVVRASVEATPTGTWSSLCGACVDDASASTSLTVLPSPPPEFAAQISQTFLMPFSGAAGSLFDTCPPTDSSPQRPIPQPQTPPPSVSVTDETLNQITSDLNYLLGKTSSTGELASSSSGRKRTGARVHINEEENVILIDRTK